eukprot:CAMPEP_0172499006 /NCGR_PEP_ID=MMETSP1066-20121228/120975_1 /TAXON_ID=671091 /ORGANISM="Coscinodiscus wailesii, Strain CCMP2513" /LENGTH=49 /DNA_ID= /DNA_START= /DNA_END= /DNA_ORIENTATION=
MNESSSSSTSTSNPNPPSAATTAAPGSTIPEILSRASRHGATAISVLSP